jgi:predicted acetyltransferase
MKMIWNAPCDDILYSKLGKESSIEVKPFVMARIIDVFEFLNRVVKDSDINLTIKINDNLAKWNNNIYEIKNGSVSINNKADDEIECSINVMTQLLMGFVKAEHAYFSGDILCNEENAVKLSEVLDKRHNYINEYF